MGTAIGAVIDWFVESLTHGTTSPAGATIPPLTVIDPSVEIADNLPRRNDGSWVIIGRTALTGGQTAAGTAAYLELGAARIEETWTLDGVILVHRTGGLQKTGRDAALALFDGVVRLIHADPTCGGVLTRGRIGLVSNVTLDQTVDDQDSVNGLVSVTIPFQVTVHNSYLP